MQRVLVRYEHLVQGPVNSLRELPNQAGLTLKSGTQTARELEDCSQKDGKQSQEEDSTSRFLRSWAWKREHR